MTETIGLQLNNNDILLIDIGEPSKNIDASQGLEQIGLGDSIRGVNQKLVAGSTDVLQRSLTGLAKTFVSSLPDKDFSEEYQLENFSVEFQITLSAEAGVSKGVVAKIVPTGGFKCTYNWSRKKEPVVKNTETNN